MADKPVDEKPTEAIVPQQQAPVALSLDTVQGFEGLQRAARMFAASDMVPPSYKGNIPNCAIALDVAMRMRINPLMVFQNLNIIHGRPGWSSAFLIATANASGRFTPLRFTFNQAKPGTDDYGCRCEAKDLKSGETLVGTEITIKLAKDNQWYGRQGSKWQTMPEQMLRYRAAAFWVRAYAPEMGLGFLTKEEWEDVDNAERRPAEKDVTPQALPEVFRPPVVMGQAPEMEMEKMPEGAPLAQDVIRTGSEAEPKPEPKPQQPKAATTKEPVHAADKLKEVTERIRARTGKRVETTIAHVSPPPTGTGPLTPEKGDALFSPTADIPLMDEDGDIKA